MTYNSQVGYYTYGIKPHAVTQAGSNTYTYDANGNMLSGAGRTLTYDHENKPTSINSMSLSYDGNGDRVKKGSTVYIEKLFECVSGSCTKYIFANGRRVALKRSTGEVNYYSQDHLGSTTIVTSATGAKVEEIYYYPYGATRSDTGSVNLTHKYTGQELDPETNLYYYGARYYDAVLARFISTDPIVPGFSDPQLLNRFSYAGNNPLRYIDPTGNQSFDLMNPLTNWDPLANFGSMSYLNSNLGSPWKLDINIPNFNINSVSNIGLGFSFSNINLNFNPNLSNTSNRWALQPETSSSSFISTLENINLIATGVSLGLIVIPSRVTNVIGGAGLIVTSVVGLGIDAYQVVFEDEPISHFAVNFGLTLFTTGAGKAATKLTGTAAHYSFAAGKFYAVGHVGAIKTQVGILGNQIEAGFLGIGTLGTILYQTNFP